MKLTLKTRDLVVLTASIYREIAISALSLFPRPSDSLQQETRHSPPATPGRVGAI